jgi:hypothetical protein
VAAEANETLARVRATRRRLVAAGPPTRRPIEGDFERVALPATEADALRDALIADRARVVIEIGLAYASSALAIAEALLLTSGLDAQHIMIDPFQAAAYSNVGWELLRDAGLGGRIDRNLGWEPVEVAGRLAARRLPEVPYEPDFTEFVPF